LYLLLRRLIANAFKRVAPTWLFWDMLGFRHSRKKPNFSRFLLWQTRFLKTKSLLLLSKNAKITAMF